MKSSYEEMVASHGLDSYQDASLHKSIDAGTLRQKKKGSMQQVAQIDLFERKKCATNAG